jgi:hypothetical protein
MAIGVSGAALAQHAVAGSDTLNGPIKAAIIASGASLSYQNLGSIPAEEMILAGTQSIGPMSRNFRESTLIAHPGWTPAVKNVIGLDAAVVVVKNGTSRCKNLSLPTDPNDPKSAQENNLLQLVLGGVGGEGTTPACADPARLQAIVDFTNCFVGLDRVEHFYRPDDRSGTAEVIKQKLKIKRFCNGAAPGPTNLDAQDHDPLRYPCIPADDTRAVTVCSDSFGIQCTAGTPGCTQGFVVALSEADPNTSGDVTVSLSRRVKNDSASVAFAGRQAVKQPQSPTNGVNINTISYAPQNIRLDQYMLSRRLYLMKADPTSDPDRNLQEEMFYDWATNPDNEVPGRAHMDPLMLQYGYVPCTDDYSVPTGANTLCVKTPFAPAPEPVAACLPDRAPCVLGVDTCCSGAPCGVRGCGVTPLRSEGFACEATIQCASPLTCTQGDWPVTTCTLAPGGISGTVVLNGGSALANVQVSATSISDKRNAMTDGSGSYSIVGLPDGEYTVLPDLYGYTFAPAQAIVTVQGGIVSGVNFTANPTYSISGTAGVTGVTLTLSGGASATTTSGKGGSYSFIGLNNGSYRITPALAGNTFNPAFLDVTVSGSSVAGQNFTVTPIGPTYTISGSAGVTGVILSLSGGAGATSTSGVDGAYQFTSLSNGSYRITPSLVGYIFTPEFLDVTVSGSNVTGQNFTAIPVPPTFSISGIVGRGGVTLTLSGDASATTTSSSKGGYQFSGLNNGSYRITPALSGYNFNPAFLDVIVNGSNLSGQNFTSQLQ